MLAKIERSPVIWRVEPLLKWRYLAITVAAYGFSLRHLHHTGKDWRFFIRGSELLFGQHHMDSRLPGGFRLYADHPGIQIGPLSLLLATPFRLFGEHSRGAVAVVLTAAAPGLIYLLERTARAARPNTTETSRLLPLTALVGGLLLAAAWAPLGTGFVHLDDVVVLALACVAMWAVACQRPAVVGITLGLAVAAKPWAVILFPLLLVLRGRARWRPFLIAVAISALAWLPFVIADAHTLAAIRPNTDTSAASIIHLFGVDLDQTPGWLRPVQLIASLVAGAVAVSRGRWPAVLAVGIAARLMFDPGTWAYYSSGMILAALAWDLLRSDHPVPLWTMATFWMLALPVGLDSTIQAVLRLIITTALLASVALAPRSEMAPEQRPSVE